MMGWQQYAPGTASAKLRPRITRTTKGKAGYTLMELLIVVAIISTVIILAGGNLRTTEQEIVDRSATRAVNLLRRAHSQAAGSSNAIVVVVEQFGNPDIYVGGATAGRLDAYVARDNRCPAQSPIAGVGGSSEYPCSDGTCTDQPYETVLIAQDDLNGNPNGSAGGLADAGIALMTPLGAANRMELCFTTLGKVLDRATGNPFPGTGDFLNGSATIWVQYQPVRLIDGIPSVPRARIVVPWSGLAGVQP